MTASATEGFGEVIYAYTRKQAIEDGGQVAVPVETSQEAGLKFPVFITREAWNKYVLVPEGVIAQDESGRLFDLLWMLRFAIQRCHQDGNTLLFQLYVRNDNTKARLVTLKCMVGPVDVDDPRPALSIMMKDED
jgi:hypothetical protein